MPRRYIAEKYEISEGLKLVDVAEEFEKNDGMITISIGFSGDKKSIISRLIMKAQKVPYSHTYIMYELAGERWLFEAGKNGVVRRKCKQRVSEVCKQNFERSGH